MNARCGPQNRMNLEFLCSVNPAQMRFSRGTRASSPGLRRCRRGSGSSQEGAVGRLCASAAAPVLVLQASLHQPAAHLRQQLGRGTPPPCSRRVSGCFLSSHWLERSRDHTQLEGMLGCPVLAKIRVSVCKEELGNRFLGEHPEAWFI